ncbi:hypothetical protein BGY98DRAFT_1179086 [Russula aff. rugulosa BPL654]|nr:hypothetical protein BGY98DRAFT_1179086 [Russula aff. rugulosa BPL654]
MYLKRRQTRSFNPYRRSSQHAPKSLPSRWPAPFSLTSFSRHIQRTVARRASPFMIALLALAWSIIYSDPGYSEEAILRCRATHSFSSLGDQLRVVLTDGLTIHLEQRFKYFGLIDYLQETITLVPEIVNPLSSGERVGDLFDWPAGGENRAPPKAQGSAHEALWRGHNISSSSLLLLLLLSFPVTRGIGMDIVKSSADLIVPLKEVVRFHWQALKPGTKHYIESAIVIVSRVYCFEGLDPHIRCQGNDIDYYRARNSHKRSALVALAPTVSFTRICSTAI